MIRTEDFDNRTYTVFKKEFYPYKPLFDKIKAMADSLVVSVYGIDFFNTHVRWNVRSSYFNYGMWYGRSWPDTTTVKPQKFLLRYDIQFDSQHLYEGMIEFQLDENGRFIGNQYEQIFGFEKLSSTFPKTFVLTREKALAFAKQQGLSETDSTKAEALLEWEGLKTENFYNGNYRYYVTINTGSTKDIRPNSRSSVTDEFDVYVFNPWTGDFIGKKKIKTTHSWEQMSGSSTGLHPTND